MSDLISLLNTFFTFIITQLGNIANFFTSNTLGIIILAITLFYIIVDVILSFLNKGK